MKTKKAIILPKYKKLLSIVGENVKLARKRRKLTTIQVAERANIVRSTLYLIENGSPSVSMGSYFNVLKVFNLQEDFLKLAADDEFGRKLQDLELLSNNDSEEPKLRRISNEINTFIYVSLKRGGYGNNKKIPKILGCSFEKLLNHLNNNKYNFIFGESCLDVDHIIPITTANNEKEVLKLSHYSNLQLLPSYFNRYIKSFDDWDSSKFEKWFYNQ